MCGRGGLELRPYKYFLAGAYPYEKAVSIGLKILSRIKASSSVSVGYNSLRRNRSWCCFSYHTGSGRQNSQLLEHVYENASVQLGKVSS